MKNLIRKIVQAISPVTWPSFRMGQPLRRADLPETSARVQGWFQRRKDAEKRLLEISNDTILLAESTYRGPESRHWLRHTDCGCLFIASEQEVAQLGPDVCPLCGVTDVKDLSRFGSIESVRELVWMMTSGRLEFCDDNVLGFADDVYKFMCHVHDCSVLGNFSSFASDPDNLCPHCLTDRLSRRLFNGDNVDE